MICSVLTVELTGPERAISTPVEALSEAEGVKSKRRRELKRQVHPFLLFFIQVFDYF